MADVFISYKREDRALAETLAAELTAKGYAVWWDTRLTAGEAFDEVIDRQLRRAKAVIVIWSPLSVQSRWVKDEAFYALQKDKLVCARTDDLEIDTLLAIYQARHLSPVTDVAALTDALDRLDTPRSAPPGSAAPAPRPTAPARDVPTLIVDPFPGRGDFTKIQAAIDTAPEGARIFIRPGTYAENLTVAKAVELIGDGPREEIRVTASDGDTLHLKAPIARVAGLTLRREPGEGEKVAVWITDGRPELTDCDISSQSLAGVDISGPAAPLIRQCRIHDGASAGVSFHTGAKGLIEDCEIHGNALANLQIRKEAAPIVRCCVLRDGQSAGLLVTEKGAGLIEDCEIFGNALANVQIISEAAPTLRRCVLRDSKQGGLIVTKKGAGRVEDCKIHDNAYAGAGVREGGRPSLRDCTISENGYWAIWIADAESGAEVTGCDLRGNARGAWDIAKGAEKNVVDRDNKV